MGGGARRLLLAVLAAVTVSPHTVSGGGSPLNTLVVVNTRSRRSVRIGEYYCRKREIPAINLVRVRVPVANDMSLDSFERLIRRPILRHIRRHGLEKQIGYLVFCGDFPYRVCRDREKNNCNSLTAAIFYGYHESPPPCSLPRDTASRYFRAGWDFLQWRRRFESPRFIAALLTGWNEDQALRLIDRSVQADGMLPSGIVYLVHTPDFDRNKRWVQYEEAARQLEPCGSSIRAVITSAWEVAHVSGVIGYMVGRHSPTQAHTVGFLPGALADHFTSWGGFLHDSSWQMSILDWISNGCVGSCGTVVEPCSYRQKFSEPLLFYWYARGFTMGESYFMSLANPYQTLVVGDPLCAPYALRARIGLRRSANSRGEWLEYRVQAADLWHPVSRVDLYVDGRWSATLTNVPPEPGNEVVLVVEGVTNVYRVQRGDRLPDVLAGLATVTSRNLPGLQVEILGDSLVLLVRKWRPGMVGPRYRAYTRRGTGARLTVWAHAAGGRMVPGRFPARQVVALRGEPAAGDRLRLKVTTLSGRTVTCRVAAVEGDTPVALAVRLREAVQSNPVLSGPDGIAVENVERVKGSPGAVFSLVSRRCGPLGAAIYVDLVVEERRGSSTLNGGYVGHLAGNARQLLPRGQVYLASGLPEVTGRVMGKSLLAGEGIWFVVTDGTAAATKTFKRCRQGE